MPIACRAVMCKEGQPFRVAPSKPFEFSAPFLSGETCSYFKQCDLFHSFHAIVKVQFRDLGRLDRAVNNYKDNLHSLYHHPDMTLTADRVLRKVIVSTYSHSIDSWSMNGACVEHHASACNAL